MHDNKVKNGAGTRIRTRDLLITNDARIRRYQAITAQRHQFDRYLIARFAWLDGAATRSRTPDPLITSQVLYQLSYDGISRSYACQPLLSSDHH